MKVVLFYYIDNIFIKNANGKHKEYTRKDSHPPQKEKKRKDCHKMYVEGFFFFFNFNFNFNFLSRGNQTRFSIMR